MLSNMNPTNRVSVDFQGYVRDRKLIESGRMDGHGLPNYAYAMDYELRKKLDAIPGLYKLGKTLMEGQLATLRQQENMSSLKVGPNQFPDIYEMGCDCARILGIGVPNIYLKNDQTTNAWAYAFDDVEPLIVVTSGLYERVTPGELRTVIGHECGHIHNQHSVYQTIHDTLVINGAVHGGLVAGLSMGALNLLTAGVRTALNAWSRAAEVTADRAGMICSENIEDNYSTEAKLMYGAAFGEHEINYAAIREQLEQLDSNIGRYHEIFSSHPSGARRIAADMEFAECETLYQWRPELKKPGITMRSKKETDDRCRKIIDLNKKG